MGQGNAAEQHLTVKYDLPAATVVAIFQDPRPFRAIAAAHGISKTLVGAIRQRQSYAEHTAHLPDPVPRPAAHKRGRHKPLTAAQVVAIFADDRPYRLIAKAYGLSTGMVCRIRRGLEYAEVSQGLTPAKRPPKPRKQPRVKIPKPPKPPKQPRVKKVRAVPVCRLKRCGKPLPLSHRYRRYCSAKCYIAGHAKAVGECWAWTGGTESDGTPRARWEGHGQPAQELSYAAFRRQGEPVPDGYRVRATCGRGECVNPRHLLATRRRPKR